MHSEDQVPQTARVDVSQLETLRIFLDGVIADDGIVSIRACDQVSFLSNGAGTHLQTLAGLRHALATLKERVDNFYTYFQASHVVKKHVSSIHTLPNEVMASIFKQCNPGYANVFENVEDVYDTSKALKERVRLSLLLSQLSRRFRGVALSVPTLWNCLGSFMNAEAISRFIARGRPGGFQVYLTDGREPDFWHGLVEDRSLQTFYELILPEIQNWAALTIHCFFYRSFTKACLSRKFQKGLPEPSQLHSLTFTYPDEDDQIFYSDMQVQLTKTLFPLELGELVDLIEGMAVYRLNEGQTFDQLPPRNYTLSKLHITSFIKDEDPEDEDFVYNMKTMVETLHAFQGLRDFYLILNFTKVSTDLPMHDWIPDSPAGFPHLRKLTLGVRCSKYETPIWAFGKLLNWLPLRQLQYLRLEFKKAKSARIMGSVYEAFRSHGPVLQALEDFSMLALSTDNGDFDVDTFLAMMPSLQVLDLDGLVEPPFKNLLTLDEPSSTPSGQIPRLRQIDFKRLPSINPGYLARLVAAIHRRKGNEPVEVSITNCKNLEDADVDTLNGLVDSIRIRAVPIDDYWYY